MKTIIRNDGRKFVVSNALYEEIQKKGLFEGYGDLFGPNYNPNTGSYNSNVTSSPVDFNNQIQNNQQNVTSNPSKQQNNTKVDKAIKNTDFNLELPFDDRKKYSNQIKTTLETLKEIYRMYAINGMHKTKPFCIVFASDKFLKNIYYRWRRIANILRKEESKYTDSDKKILATVDFSKPANLAMAAETEKLYKDIMGK